MLNVGESFKKAAEAAGREPFCVIKAGDKTFLDDSIKSFELQEVIFPDELTFGSACSARFHFELNTNENIPLSACIKPYIGFGEYSENSELCPLGTFYISKRYRRFENYSVTCYDRMYTLEDKFASDLTFPVSSEKILAEICNSFGLEFSGSCPDFFCSEPPYADSVRNVLGYLAGLDGRCAVFDRYGKLTFREIKDSGFKILRDNYVSLDLKQDPMTVSKIRVSNGNDVFEEGEGSRLDTYEIYDPFAGERTAKEIYEKFKDLNYYGLELDMQGLPFLEAGDIITVQNDTDDGIFKAVIGELDFTYDGSFWCKLYSRSKNPADNSEENESIDEQIGTMSEILKTIYYSVKNDGDIYIASYDAPLAEIDLEATDETSLVLHATMEAKAESDCVLTLTCTAEDKPYTPSIRVNLKAGEYFPICLHNFFPALTAGVYTVKVMGNSEGGRVFFPKEKILVTVSGQNLAANSLNRSPHRTLYVESGAIELERREYLALFTESVQTGLCDRKFDFEDSFARLPLGTEKYRINIGAFEEETVFIPIPQSAEIYSLDDIMYVNIYFYNPIIPPESGLDTQAFTVTAIFFDDTEETHTVSEAKWDGNTLVELTLNGKFVGAQTVFVNYNSDLSGIYSQHYGDFIPSFTIEAQQLETEE